jgi:hypothetical protein
MSLNMLDGIQLSITKPVNASDASIMVAATDAVKLNRMAIGSWIYLTIRQGGIFEVVKYAHQAEIIPNSAIGNIIAVARDQSGGGRKNFAAPVCAVADWSVPQLKEFICQTMASC